jgi:Flp pilus assembly protein TadG
MKRPIHSSIRHCPGIAPQKRRGAAAVELALMIPLFVTLTLGMIQTGIQVTAAHSLNSALREAGRLASMNYSSRLQSGQTVNQKIIEDIQNFLTAEGINGSQVSVTITSATGSSAGSTFNISDPNNQYGLFKIQASIPASAITSINFLPSAATTISSSVVFELVPNGLSN